MTALQQHVIKWLTDKEESGYTRKQILEDLQRSGCQSGMVNHLIYHTDCVKFCAEYWQDIESAVTELTAVYGSTDFICDENGAFSFSRLAWLAFEHTAFEIYSELEETEAA